MQEPNFHNAQIRKVFRFKFTMRIFPIEFALDLKLFFPIDFAFKTFTWHYRWLFIFSLPRNNKQHEQLCLHFSSGSVIFYINTALALQHFPLGVQLRKTFARGARRMAGKAGKVW